MLNALVRAHTHNARAHVNRVVNTITTPHSTVRGLEELFTALTTMLI